MDNSYSNRNYVIFDISELYKVDFSQVMETSENTIRKSVDGIKSFVKWESPNTPSFLESMVSIEGPYNYEEIHNILSTDEWKHTFSSNVISSSSEY